MKIRPFSGYSMQNKDWNYEVITSPYKNKNIREIR